jgi:hypothetical protein
MACQVKNQYAVCKISGDTTCGISGCHKSFGNAERGAFLHNVKLIILLSHVIWFGFWWEQLRAVRALAMDKTNIIPSEHLARTNEPEAKQRISNTIG